MEEILKVITTIQLGRLQQFIRDAYHELAQEEDVEGRKAHRQDDRPRCLHDAQPSQDRDAWCHRDLKRKNHQNQNAEEEQIAPVELEAAQAIRRQRHNERLPDQNRPRVHHAVAEQLQIRRFFDENLVVLPEREHRG